MKSVFYVAIVIVILFGHVSALSKQEECLLTAVNAYQYYLQQYDSISQENRTQTAIALTNCYLIDSRDDWILNCSTADRATNCIATSSNERFFSIFSTVEAQIEEIILGLVQDLVQRHHFNQIAESIIDARSILDEALRTHTEIEASVESLSEMRRTLAPKLSTLVTTAGPVIQLGNSANPILHSMANTIDSTISMTRNWDRSLHSILGFAIGLPLLWRATCALFTTPSRCMLVVSCIAVLPIIISASPQIFSALPFLGARETLMGSLLLAGIAVICNTQSVVKNE